MAATRTDQTHASETPSLLIADLWRRACRLHSALGQARGSADPMMVSAIRLQLRSMALLAASMPAASMDDLGPKLMFAALFHDHVADEDSYTLVLLERAIALDRRRLHKHPLAEMTAAA